MKLLVTTDLSAYLNKIYAWQEYSMTLMCTFKEHLMLDC